MAINVSVQYNGGLLPDIILLTQCYYHRGTRLRFFFKYLAKHRCVRHNSRSTYLWCFEILTYTIDMYDSSIFGVKPRSDPGMTSFR